MHRLAGFTALVCLVAVVAGGCQLLSAAGIPTTLPGGLPIGGTSGDVAGATAGPGDHQIPPGAFDGAPRPVAAYGRGHATIILGDGSRYELDRINRGPHLFVQFGSHIRWSNNSGWYLTIAGAGAEPDMGAPYLMLDRVTGTQHWSADDPLACQVTVTSATPAKLSGTANCRDVRWIDALDTTIDGDHPLIEGRPPFSATVTFEATP